MVGACYGVESATSYRGSAWFHPMGSSGGGLGLGLRAKGLGPFGGLEVEV